MDMKNLPQGTPRTRAEVTVMCAEVMRACGFDRAQTVAQFGEANIIVASALVNIGMRTGLSADYLAMMIRATYADAVRQLIEHASHGGDQPMSDESLAAMRDLLAKINDKGNAK